jgi:hypothetical protein
MQYDIGTRGTTLGRDRLMERILPNIVNSIESMTKRYWYVDVYLILGYPHLDPDRRKLMGRIARIRRVGNMGGCDSVTLCQEIQQGVSVM